ncbi:hypothetical protein Hanom_Chr16g01474181 [Helianthus anomalus]
MDFPIVSPPLLHSIWCWRRYPGDFLRVKCWYWLWVHLDRIWVKRYSPPLLHSIWCWRRYPGDFLWVKCWYWLWVHLDRIWVKRYWS